MTIDSRDETVTRNMMIICAALISGVVFLAVLLISMKLSAGGNTGIGAEPAEDSSNDMFFGFHILTLASMAFFLINVPAAIVIPGFLKRSAVSRNNGLEAETALRVANGTTTTANIVRFAFLEGTSFFSLIAFFISGSWLALLPALLCLFAMLALFPLPSRFLETRDDLWQQMRA